VYAVSEKTRSVSDRSIMMFTLSLMIIITATIFFNSNYKFMRDMRDVVSSTGFLLTFLWFNVLSFDIFWSMKTFRAPSETMQRFKFYCCYVFVMPLIFFLLVLLSHFINRSYHYLLSHLVLFVLLGSFVLDIIFLLIAGYMIFKISKSCTTIEHARFETERDR
jgi:hypothetical protein